FSDDQFARNKSPVAAVLAVIAVVAHRKIKIGRHDHFVSLEEGGVPGDSIQIVGRITGKRRKQPAIAAIHHLLVRLGQRLSIDKDLRIVEANSVARQANRPLYIVLGEVARVLENNDVATVDIPKRKERVHERAAGTIGKFVHQQMVADQKIVLHGGRRYLERLNDEGRAEKGENDRDGQR